MRIGITGVPGVGKSTTIESLGIHLIEQPAREGVEDLVTEHGAVVIDERQDDGFLAEEVPQPRSSRANKFASEGAE